MKSKETHLYMAFAKRVSLMSHCQRLKVGAVLARPGGLVVSYGYNGTATGRDNCCEEYSDTTDSLVTKPEVIHAEMNAIMKAAKEGRSTKDAWMFITHAPCVECSKLVAAAGITTVVFLEEYRNLAGIRLLQAHKIMCYTYIGRDGMTEMEVEQTPLEVNSFKLGLDDALNNGLVEVTFTKKNGEIRVMKCTKNFNLIPPDKHPKDQAEPGVTSTTPPGVTSTTPVLTTVVFDVIINEWRSFRNDSVIRSEVIY